MTSELLSVQFGYTHYVVNANSDGLSREDSLSETPGGNCFNWVMGHILASRNGLLRTLGKEPVWDEAQAERYARGSAPITDGSEAARLDEMLKQFNASQAMVLKGLSELTPERMAEKAPFSPTNNDEETIGSLVAGLLFHEAYHAGQLGVIRRVIGKPGVLQ